MALPFASRPGIHVVRQGPDPASSRPMNATFVVLLRGADGGDVPVVNATGAVMGQAADYDGAGECSARFLSKLTFACPAGEVSAHVCCNWRALQC